MRQDFAHRDGRHYATLDVHEATGTVSIAYADGRSKVLTRGASPHTVSAVVTVALANLAADVAWFRGTATEWCDVCEMRHGIEPQPCYR